jgi:hypothetical protein
MRTEMNKEAIKKVVAFSATLSETIQQCQSAAHILCTLQGRQYFGTAEWFLIMYWPF